MVRRPIDLTVEVESLENQVVDISTQVEIIKEQLHPGFGINIADNAISVDTDVIATKDYVDISLENAVPTRLGSLASIDISDTSKYSKSHIYVDQDGENKKMSLDDIKKMNTKILTTNTKTDPAIDKLYAGDFVFIENK